MKNKKNENWYWENRLIVVVVFILIFGVGLVCYKVLTKPDFIFEKEECNNLTICGGELIKNLNTFSVGEIYKVFLVPSWNNTFEYWYQKCKTEQICNKIKVDEIYIRCINEIGNSISCESIPKDIHIACEIKCKEGVTSLTGIYYNETTGDYTAYYFKKISKKNLTKEWLEGNCECIEKEYTCPYFFYKMYNYSSFGRTNFVCYSPQMINCLTSYHIGACSGQAKNPIIKCQKYKCFENYFIELK